jgi:hypothetical protein
MLYPSFFSRSFPEPDTGFRMCAAGMFQDKTAKRFSSKLPNFGRIFTTKSRKSRKSSGTKPRFLFDFFDLFALVVNFFFKTCRFKGNFDAEKNK